MRVAQYLQDEASRLNSRVLSALAVRAEADPFSEVKKMIKDLIVRLMEEVKGKAEHKGWCDTELLTNEQTRKLKELEASMTKVTEETVELSKAGSGHEVPRTGIGRVNGKEGMKAEHAVPCRAVPCRATRGRAVPTSRPLLSL